MAKFICLNEACGNNRVRPLIVNIDHIQHICVGNKGLDVHIRMSDKTFFFVRESLEEVKQQIYGEAVTTKQQYQNLTAEYDNAQVRFVAQPIAEPIIDWRSPMVVVDGSKEPAL